METKLKVILKCLKGSSLKVNESNTERSLFHLKETRPVEISVYKVLIKLKDQMNALSDSFNSKLTWAKHVAIQAKNNNNQLNYKLTCTGGDVVFHSGTLYS